MLGFNAMGDGVHFPLLHRYSGPVVFGMNLKVLQVWSNFLSPACGVGQSVMYLSAELARRGVEVGVLTSENRKWKGKKGNWKMGGRSKAQYLAHHPSVTAEELGLPVGGFEVVPTVPGWGVRHLPAILREVQRIEPDVVHLHFVHHGYGRGGVATGVILLPLLARRVLGISVVTTSHELVVPWGVSWKQDLVSLWERATLALLLRTSSQAVTTVSAWVPVLEKWVGQGRVLHIPVGANNPVYPLSPEEQGRLRSSLTEGRAVPLLLTFGSLHPGKRHGEVLRCVADLCRRGMSVQLVCAGRRPEGEEAYGHTLLRLQREWGLDDCVRWMGFYLEEELSHYLQVADLCLLLFQDGASERRTTLMTALAHGTPVVTTKGRWWWPGFARAGAVAVVEEGETVAAVVERLLHQPDLRREMARRGRRLFEERFSWARIAEQYLQCYRGANSKRGGEIYASTLRSGSSGTGRY